VEDRYFLAAYFPLMLLFAQGLRAIQGAAGWVAATACALFCIFSMPGGTWDVRRTGYAELAAAIPADPRMPAILISSDAVGEGSFIAERLIRDPAREGLVLRASKMLSNLDSLGHRKPLMQTAEQVREFLNRTPVRFIVLDMNGYLDPASRPHHRLLEEAIRGEPTQFRPMADFSLYFDGRRRDGAVEIYENLGARPRPAGTIRIEMANSLGRTIEAAWQGGKGAAAPPPEVSGGLPAWLTRLLPRSAATSSAAPSAFAIAPHDDRVGAAGGWGRIYATARPGYAWRARALPDWITIVSGASGQGNGVLAYRVAPNESAQDRWDVISVGDEPFRLMQACFPYIQLPFVETFAAPGKPPAEAYSYLPRPSRWRLDEPVAETSLSVTAEGPDGRDSLLLDGPTAVHYAGIDIDPGAGYRLSFWLKARHPTQVSVRFGQKIAPFNRCGLDQPIDVSESWRQVTIWFQARGEGCGSDENQLSIQAGRSTGKLWLSQVSLHREALQSGGAEQLHGEGQP
jgi:hypothetical protein